MNCDRDLGFYADKRLVPDLRICWKLPALQSLEQCHDVVRNCYIVNGSKILPMIQLKIKKNH